MTSPRNGSFLHDGVEHHFRSIAPSFGVDNYAAIVLVAPIAAHVARIAPGVTLDFRPSGTLNVLEQLDRSELHLAIGPFGVQGERFSRRRLLQDQFVLVHRKGHPTAKTREISTEKLARLPQLEISSAQFGPDLAETDPGKSKLSLRAAMRAPFLSAAQILETSDLVSVLPLKVQKHDEVPPPCFPSLVAFVYTDRDHHDLAATA